MKKRIRKPMNQETRELRKQMRSLRARLAEEWAGRIEFLCDGLLREKVKCIVWWDFLGGRNAVLDPLPGFESVTALFGTGHGIPAETVIPILLQLGYPKLMAEERGLELKHSRGNESMRRYRGRKRIKG